MNLVDISALPHHPNLLLFCTFNPCTPRSRGTEFLCSVRCARHRRCSFGRCANRVDVRSVRRCSLCSGVHGIEVVCCCVGGEGVWRCVGRGSTGNISRGCRLCNSGAIIASVLFTLASNLCALSSHTPSFAILTLPWLVLLRLALALAPHLHCHPFHACMRGFPPLVCVHISRE